jgi:hypothetical protein
MSMGIPSAGLTHTVFIVLMTLLVTQLMYLQDLGMIPKISSF